MKPAQATLLPDGKRLHLHHGPIDLIVQAWGSGRQAAYERATTRFQTILQGLVEELPTLRTPLAAASAPDRTRPAPPGRRRSSPIQGHAALVSGPVAQRMIAACDPFAIHFITPMAAVAGAVADEILAHLTADPDITKAYVNNGGDVAFHVNGTHTMTTASATTPPATITLTAADPWRGMATSGWRGRSHSLGIADSVTVLATTAARADAAATMIANAVDLPGDPRITRKPAHDLAPDSDLGHRLVTTGVAPLDPASRARALQAGLDRAADYVARGLIGAAYLTLQGDGRTAGDAPIPHPHPERLHA